MKQGVKRKTNLRSSSIKVTHICLSDDAIIVGYILNKKNKLMSTIRSTINIIQELGT